MPPTTPADLVQDIRDDHQHGASEVARRALCGLAALSRELDRKQGRDQLLDTGRRLRDCRPAMAPVRNLLGRWLEQAEALPAQDHHWLQRAGDSARELARQSEQAVSALARHAARALSNHAILMTHSRSSTLLALGQARARLGNRGQWWLTRSEPDHEGLTLARELRGLAAEVTLFTEAQGALLMPDVDALVVGADCVLGNGDVVNKVGTCLLALAAAEAGKPLLCLCESFKFTSDDHFEPEPHDILALQLPDIEGLRGLNFTFDRTPARLVSAWVTESGIASNGAAVVPWPT